MNRSELEVLLRTILERLTEKDVSQVPRNAELGDTIGLDSLGRLELLSEIEDRLNLTIYDIDSDKASTINGMLEIVETAISENAEAV